LKDLIPEAMRTLEEVLEVAEDCGVADWNPQLESKMIDRLEKPTATAIRPYFPRGGLEVMSKTGTKGNSKLRAAAGHVFRVMKTKDLKRFKDRLKKKHLPKAKHTAIADQLYYYLRQSEMDPEFDEARHRRYRESQVEIDPDEMIEYFESLDDEDYQPAYVTHEDDEWRATRHMRGDDHDPNEYRGGKNTAAGPTCCFTVSKGGLHCATISSHLMQENCLFPRTCVRGPPAVLPNWWVPPPAGLEYGTTPGIQVALPEKPENLYTGLSYAVKYEECRPVQEATGPECARFDAAVAAVIRDVDKLTLDQFHHLIDQVALSGVPTLSAYARQYAFQNQPFKANGAPAIKHCRALRRHRNTPRPGEDLVDPPREGLFKDWPELWEAEADGSLGRAKAVLPPTGTAGVIDSMNANLVDNSDAQDLHPYTAAALASGYVAPVWEGDKTIKRHLQAIYAEISAVKTAGHTEDPSLRTKGDCMADTVWLAGLICHWMLLLATPFEALSHLTPADLYRWGYGHVESMGVKREATKRPKADRRAWRSLWKSNFRQEIVSRLIHGPLNSAETAAYQHDLTHSEEFPTFGNGAGLGHSDSGLSATRRAIKRLLESEDGKCRGGGFCADRSTWDMRISRHLWMGDGRFRAMLEEHGQAPRSQVLAQLKLSLVHSAHVVAVGNFIYEVTIFGFMPSGIFSTAHSNGHMNQLSNIDKLVCDFFAECQTDFADVPWDALLAAIREGLSLVMGDDSVSRGIPAPTIEDFVSHAWKLGILVTGAEKGQPPKVTPKGEPTPFTSHLYNLEDVEGSSDDPSEWTNGWVAARFDNFTKLALRLAMFKPGQLKEEQARGVLFACRHSHRLEDLRQMLRTFDPAFALLPTTGNNIDLTGFL